MAKDPAVLFYTSDFLTGCLDLDFEERGQYITMLCLQHQKGRLSEKTIRLSVGSVSVFVLEKFIIDEDGLYYNLRMEEEIVKRLEFTDSRRQNGALGGRPKKANAKPSGLPNAKPSGKAKKNLPENENENDILIPSIEEIKKYTLEKGYEVDANKIWHYYNDNKWIDAKGNKVKNWKTKILNNWCKEENKTKPKYTGEPRFKVKYRSDTRYHIHTEAQIKEHEKLMLTTCYQRYDYND